MAQGYNQVDGEDYDEDLLQLQGLNQSELSYLKLSRRK